MFFGIDVFTTKKKKKCATIHAHNKYNLTHVFVINTFFYLDILQMFGAMHFIYYINRSIATKVDSTYLGY